MNYHFDEVSEKQFLELLGNIRRIKCERDAVNMVDAIYKFRDNHTDIKVTNDACNFLKSEVVRVCKSTHIPIDRVTHKIALGTGKLNLYKAYIKYGDIYIVTQHGISAQAEYDAEIKVIEDWKKNLKVEIVPESEKDLRDEYKLKRISKE